MLQQTTHHETFSDQPDRSLYTYSPEVRELGYTLQSVEVPDMSESSPEFAANTEAFRQLDERLAQNPLWEAPQLSQDKTRLILDPDNHATNTIYGENEDSTTMREWYLKLVPSALALEALALKSKTLPTTDIEIDQNAFDIFMYAADARSIRSRGALMSELIAEHSATKSSGEPQKWLSLACGAARPVLEAAARVKADKQTPIDVTLVDFDPVVLDYSSKLADSMGAVTGHREIESDLCRSMIPRDTLVEELGEESMDVVDVLGFLEYCSDKSAMRMLRNSYRLVAPGGVLITSNMRDDRPEKQLHLRGIGWPGVKMRSSDELIEVAIQAGINPSCIEAYQPTDGVYTVFKITKP